MPMLPRPRLTLRLLIGLLLLGSLAHAADEDAVLTSVYSKTGNGYQRKRGPDGQWQREYYALSNGGPADGTVKDNEQDKIQFVALARVLAEHLARQGYFPATDPKKVDLLIVVNWGRTTPFNDSTYKSGAAGVMSAMNEFSNLTQSSAMTNVAVNATSPGGAPQPEVNLTGSVQDMQAQAAQSQLNSAIIRQELFNRARDQDNEKNARLLGYMGDINESDGIQRLVGGGARYEELLADIEEARYYVILSAYDFKKTVREKKTTLQWVTRMSMRAPGNSFAEKAASMIAYGATRFGQNTTGLERRSQPVYRVNLGETKFLGEAPKPAAP